MDKCTIHRFKMKILPRTGNLHDFKGIEKLTVCLSDLKDFDKPLIEKKRWGRRVSERTFHVTPEVWVVLGPTSDLSSWISYLMLFMTTWIFAEHDRAVRINLCYAYSDMKTEDPFEVNVTLDFIEFGDKAKTPESLSKLSKCLAKLQGKIFSPAAYETLNQHFPNFLSKKNLIGSSSFWIQIESNFEPIIEFSRTKPTWLSYGIDLKGEDAPEDAPLEWMKDIIVCFIFLVKMYPEFGIVLKKVEVGDTKLTFFVENGDISHFSIFLGTFNNFPKEKTSVALVKGALCLLPVVGSCMTIHDSITAFKTGNPKTGMFCLAMGTVGLVADAFLVGGPLVSLTAKVASGSSKVVSACEAITRATATAQKVTGHSKKLITIGQDVAQMKALKCSSVEPVSREKISDKDLLKIVFPRLAKDIFPEPC